MENDLVQVKYALDTFYFLMSGALVMWMAAGFTMLEAGLVRSKNTTEILTFCEYVQKLTSKKPQKCDSLSGKITMGCPG